MIHTLVWPVPFRAPPTTARSAHRRYFNASPNVAVAGFHLRTLRLTALPTGELQSVYAVTGARQILQAQVQTSTSVSPAALNSCLSYHSCTLQHDPAGFSFSRSSRPRWMKLPGFYHFAVLFRQRCHTSPAKPPVMTAPDHGRLRILPGSYEERCDERKKDRHPEDPDFVRRRKFTAHR
jgi:hypothetical protein